MLEKKLLTVCWEGCSLWKDNKTQSNAFRLSVTGNVVIRWHQVNRNVWEIPAKLILNWDHTGLNYVPLSSWTLEKKGAQKVPIAAIDDKRQITAIFACSLAGDFLPLQMIYAEKTPGCLPNTPSYQVGMLRMPITTGQMKQRWWIMCVAFSPYLEATRKELQLPSEFPAILISSRTNDWTISRIHGTKQCQNCENVYQTAQTGCNLWNWTSTSLLKTFWKETFSPTSMNVCTLSIRKTELTSLPNRTGLDDHAS